RSHCDRPLFFIWLKSAALHTSLVGVKHLRQYLQTPHRNLYSRMLNPLHSFAQRFSCKNLSLRWEVWAKHSQI
ncbi:MAG: hypothetical protein LH649_05105, partial [Pseudanabaena sp. CAN_BIN31]|nr:hypothetical protein [Pseudanabaena sp. CAN_BIN31]